MFKQIFDLPIAIAKYLYSMLCCTANKDKSHCIVYTDGSCINQGKETAKAGFGVCWHENDHPNNYSGKVHGLQDSGHAELCAAKHAIKQAIDYGYRSITIRADSELVGHVVRDPKAFSERSHPDYHDVISSINLMKSQIDINVEYVKAHNGIPGNEKADQLAKLGARAASMETVWRYTEKMRKMMDRRRRERRGRGTVADLETKELLETPRKRAMAKDEMDVATTVPMKVSTVTKKTKKPKRRPTEPTVTKPPTVSCTKSIVPFKPRPHPLKKLKKSLTLSLLSISSASRLARRIGKRTVPLESTKVTVGSQNSENSIGQQKQQAKPKDEKNVVTTKKTKKPKRRPAEPIATTQPTVSSTRPTVPFKPRPRPLKKLMKSRTISLLSICSATRVARRIPRRRNNPVPMHATKVTVDPQNSKNSVGQKEKEKQKVTQTPTTVKPKPTRRANKRKHSKTATVTQKTTKPNQENL